MTPTTTSTGSEFAQDLAGMVNNAIAEGSKQAARMLWLILKSFLVEHWLVLMIILFFAFVVATLKVMMGRWGTLGSLLYNSLYFGTLFIIGLIWGPEVFVNDFWNVVFAVILYPVCYNLVRLILIKLGVDAR